MRILAGDLGGTKTNLAVYGAEAGRLRLVREASLPTRAGTRFEELLDRFREGPDERFAAAAFGVAGPVQDGRSHLTNLGWDLDQGSLSAHLGGTPVRLLNDLEATAHGLAQLAPEQVLALQGELPSPPGPGGLIAVGTGLGEAILAWDGTQRIPMATEGGHADFAPRNAEEMRLLAFMLERHSRVSYERVLSGPGLTAIYEFCLREAGGPEARPVTEARRGGDPSAEVARLGEAGQDPVATRALGIFVGLYGAEAGNLALRTLARGGLWIGGGVAPKLAARMKGEGFLAAFRAKGRFEAWLAGVPVYLVLEPKTALLGAAGVAAGLARPGSRRGRPPTGKKSRQGATASAEGQTAAPAAARSRNQLTRP